MPLEATMMIIDNSEYMRNGDYQPTRFGAQSDAVNVIFQTKTDSNPESTIGVMTMAGKGPEVLVTNTKDLGQVLQGLHIASNKIGGEINIPTAIAVAQLALKHRENKNLRQRIMVFVASPLQGAAADEKAMVKLAKKLKKNNVAVDIIAFGDGIEEADEEGKTVLKTFVENVNSSDNSHLVTIAPGSALLSDCILSSAALAADRGALIPEELREGGDASGSGAGGGAGSGGDFEFGIDPSLDPELAMALRLSMQEAQAREAAENVASSSNTAQAAASSTSAAAGDSSGTAAESTTEEMDPELAKALALSEEKDVDMVDEEEDEEEDEDAAIARAIEMSMQGQEEEEEEEEKKKP